MYLMYESKYDVNDDVSTDTAKNQSVWSGVVQWWSTGLETLKLQFKSHLGTFASNLQQVANLQSPSHCNVSEFLAILNMLLYCIVLCARGNLASYPQWDATGKMLRVAGRGGGMSTSCTVSPIIYERKQWMAI